MSELRLNQLPDGSGSLSNDDIFIFMDDPSGSGITKKISFSQISGVMGGGGGNSFDQSLNTTDSPTFAGLNIEITEGASMRVWHGSQNNGTTIAFNGITFSDLTNQITASPYTRSLLTGSAPSDFDNIKPIFGGTNTLDYDSTNCIIFNGGNNTINHGINCTINGNNNLINDMDTYGISSCHILGNFNEIRTIFDEANDCIIIGNNNTIRSHGINSLYIIGNSISTEDINPVLLNNTLWVNNLGIKDGALVILNLPTSDPASSGTIWNSGGILAISNG